MNGKSMNDKTNENSESTCKTCKHSIWMVGISLGMRCKHPENMLPNSFPKLIPNRNFSCSHYEADDDDTIDPEASSNQ